MHGRTIQDEIDNVLYGASRTHDQSGELSRSLDSALRPLRELQSGQGSVYVRQLPAYRARLGLRADAEMRLRRSLDNDPRRHRGGAELRRKIPGLHQANEGR